eukprot:TRINITY_DN21772_c0_g1_i2.p1 TRINITY_DN21772_c0_g1~~TRINITY_DN21772_c0_g1_i2.p1  ORF type:complete len:651 (-),score=190.63 TRINITY_DN21772_c0_g1_i2:31-1983(-)
MSGGMHVPAALQLDFEAFFAMAIFSYQPEDKGEVGFDEGQIMKIVGENEFGWWLSQNTNGDLGWVPSNFFQKVDASTVNTELFLPPPLPAASNGTSNESQKSKIDTDKSSKKSKEAVNEDAEPGPVVGKVSESNSKKNESKSKLEQAKSRIESAKQKSGRSGSVEKKEEPAPPIPKVEPEVKKKPEIASKKKPEHDTVSKKVGPKPVLDEVVDAPPPPPDDDDIEPPRDERGISAVSPPVNSIKASNIDSAKKKAEEEKEEQRKKLIEERQAARAAASNDNEANLSASQKLALKKGKLFGSTKTTVRKDSKESAKIITEKKSVEEDQPVPSGQHQFVKLSSDTKKSIKISQISPPAPPAEDPDHEDEAPLSAPVQKTSAKSGKTKTNASNQLAQSNKMDAFAKANEAPPPPAAIEEEKKVVHPQKPKVKATTNTAVPSSAITNDSTNNGANAASETKTSDPCMVCSKPLSGIQVKVEKLGSIHLGCLKCSTCQKNLAEENPDNPNVHSGKLYCNEHFHAISLAVCAKCKLELASGSLVRAMGKSWHKECFMCGSCGQPFKDNKFHRVPDESLPVCADCFKTKFAPNCSVCKRPIAEGVSIKVLNKNFHQGCFTCPIGNHPLSTNGPLKQINGILCCADHVNDLLIQIESQ